MRFKAGMLCIIVPIPPGHNGHEHSGRIVTILERSRSLIADAFVWTVAESIEPYKTVREKVLRPISDPDIDVTETDKQELTA